MADLEYSPAVIGFVPFGTVATATTKTDPVAVDALFIRAGGTVTLPDFLKGTTLTIGDDTAGATATPIVILGPGTHLNLDVTLAAHGTLHLGPAPAAADPNTPAVLTGALIIEAGATVEITAGLIGGPITAAGTIAIAGFATIAAAITFPATPHITSTATSVLTLNTNLTSALVFTLLGNPAFAGSIVFGGTLDNAGATLDTAAHAALSFTNATITGGTLTSGSAAILSATTLDGVTLAGTLNTPFADYNLATGTISGNGTIAVNGAFGFSGTAIIAGPTVTLGTNASLYGAGTTTDVTFAAGTTVTIGDAATLNFAATGSRLRLDGGLNLTDSVAPYVVVVTLNAGLGFTVISAAATLRIGANATLTLNTALKNSGTVNIAGGTMELVQASITDGSFRFTASDARLRLDKTGQTVTLIDFADSQRLVFPTASTSNRKFALNGNTLDVTSGVTSKLDGRFVLLRSDASLYTLANFTFTTDGTALAVATTGIAVTACYAAGTRILTATGERAIETLRAGDRVRTLAGRLAPIIWIGHRRLDLHRHPRPHDVMPVRIHAHAFGPNLPHRDLVLSPDHAIYAEGVLIPIRYLLNGATIVQEPRRNVTWFHLELATHDIILAEGLAGETYLDTGNRAAFANGGTATTLHPDFALRVWQAKSCAPLATTGETVALVRHTLLAQAHAIGHRRTADPAFALIASPTRTHLQSRHFIPAHIDPASTDHRPLGIAVTRITADGLNIPLTDPRLTTGWHPPEPGLRWTNGNAAIAIAAAQIEIQTTPQAAIYWQPSRAEKRHAAN